MINLEVCAGSIESVRAAKHGGADRVELCSALSEGGITPSAGLIRAAKAENIRTHVLIRPRPGDFLYSSAEFSLMREDVLKAKDFGADGVVVGMLTENGEVDAARLEELVRLAGSMSVTFHRAFDMASSPSDSLKKIIDAGCQFLLTSGMSQSAEDGIPMLRELVNESKGKIRIMAGAGVNSSNAEKIIRETGVRDIHASARSLQRSRMRFRQEKVSMGSGGLDEYAVWETDAAIVEAIKSAFGSMKDDDNSIS